MQQHLMQMQPMMAAYYPNNVTTDHIQQVLFSSLDSSTSPPLKRHLSFFSCGRGGIPFLVVVRFRFRLSLRRVCFVSALYLDENKSLILKIVESQSSGKLSECAENQARLQRNLMYLAAIADSQPQPPTMAGQYPGSGMMQQGGHYVQAQQAAAAAAQQMTQQQLMAARSSLLYAQQQPYAALQQQGLHGQLGMSSSGGGGGLHMLHGEASSGNMGGGGGGYPDFVRGSGAEGRSIIGSSSSKQEMGEGRGGGGGGGSSSGHTGEGGETMYLKSADE
ncbi:uncharacterized protein [Arachis hypogaea]|uniref:uncharacterized protein isoform X1 n=1 Tax=Arachis hypogaea TaxID=3818 RepID=UPI003B07D361|nr:GRF1-interacting factor [Arachis hypogaea]